MGATLPEIDRAMFVDRLQRVAAPVSEPLAAALWCHYQELRRWNARLSLVGPGTADEVIERHYGESLAARPLLPPATTLLDVGSGGGFPGWVLAAADPDLEVTLVEARERKWAFLVAAARRAGLSVQCLDVRVDSAFDVSCEDGYDLVTWRAVRLPEATLARLAAIGRRMLVWCGAEPPSPPAGWQCARQVALAGSERRQIVEWLPSE